MSKVSIITINYNNAAGLEKTLASVVIQNFSDFEYIVIDGASTDGSTDVIKKYSEKINYWVSEPDSGIYNAMNKGIRQAKGEYLLFINSGDTLYNNEVLSTIFEDEVIQDLVYGDLHRTFPDGKEDIIQMPDHISVMHMIRSTLTHPTTFIKRALFEKHGLYREDLKIVSDWAFFLKIIVFSNTSQKHIPVVISTFDMDGISTRNEGVVSNERYKVINESFSPELNYICHTQELYADFYNKKVFRVLRSLKNIIRNLLSVNYWKDSFYKKRINGLIFCFNKTVREQKKNYLQIPIIIINYNRLEDLKEIVSFYLSRNHQNIVIVDNKSTYLPLLDYYQEIAKESRVTVKIMDRNYGHTVFWDNNELFQEYANGYYIITDPDVIPNINLPEDYLLTLVDFLDRYPQVTKVGFALRIDDIPDFFTQKDIVRKWESKFWEKQIEKDAYLAEIDTTFAVYPPLYRRDINNFTNAIRLAGNFTATHNGWYINPTKLSDEECYYYRSANTSNSWRLNENGEFDGSEVYTR